MRTRHVVSLAYARHGLAGILTTLGVGSGDEVLLSPLTCKIVPLALLSLGIRPLYADIDAGTLNLDAAPARERLSPRTRAVLFQHTYGQARGIAEVAELAGERGLALIEDCAQCTPCSGRQEGVAPRGLAAVFSNNLRKPMPAGSGGFVATDDDGLADSLRAYRDRMPARGAVSRLGHRIESYLHARLLGPRTYWPLFWLHRAATGTYRTSPLRDQIASEMESTRYRVARHQYAAGLAWLERLPALAAHRRDCGRRYLEALGGLSDVETPAAAGGDPLYFFPVLVRDKPTLLRRARARSLEIVAWPVTTPIYPVEDPSVLGSYGYELGSCPVAEDVAGRLVGLPTDLRTRTGHLEAIIALVKEHGATV